MENSILHDRRRSGKETRWKEHKRQNLQFAKYLQQIDDTKGNRAKECGETLRFVVMDDGYLKLKQTWFCKNRLCPLCNWRRALKNANQLRRILQVATQQQSDARFIFLTLTIESVLGNNLKTALQQLSKGDSRLLQYVKVSKDLLGYVRTTEITVNTRTSVLTYHPHLHILLMVTPNYLKKDMLLQPVWTNLWQRAMRLPYSPVVDVKAVKSDSKHHSLLKSAQEVAKYQTKSIDFLSHSDNQNFEIIRDLSHGLAGSRQISYGGRLKKIRKDLHLKDVEESNLIDTDSNNTNNDETNDYIVAKWNTLLKNYVIVEQ